MFQTTEYAKQTKWIRIFFGRKERKKRKESRAYLKTLRLCDSAFSALKTKTLRRQSTRSRRLKPIRSARGVRVRHARRHRVLHLHGDRLTAVKAPAVAHADSAVPCSIHGAAEYMNSLEFEGDRENGKLPNLPAKPRLVGSRCQQSKNNAQNDYPDKPHNTHKARPRAVA
jgi:hypothetical protein